MGNISGRIIFYHGKVKFSHLSVHREGYFRLLASGIWSLVLSRWRWAPPITDTSQNPVTGPVWRVGVSPARIGRECMSLWVVCLLRSRRRTFLFIVNSVCLTDVDVQLASCAMYFLPRTIKSTGPS